MIKVSPVSRNPWFPGAAAGESAPPSKRSAEIAKRQEELLELLRDVPEQELELSLTDLVEEGVSIAEGITVVSAEYSTPASVSGEAAKSKQQQRSSSSLSSSAKKRKKEASSDARRFRSRSDSVLLRFYVPASLTRSRTAPAGPRQHGFLRRDDGSNFDGEIQVTSLGCWSALWNRKTKSRRQML